VPANAPAGAADAAGAAGAPVEDALQPAAGSLALAGPESMAASRLAAEGRAGVVPAKAGERPRSVSSVSSASVSAAAAHAAQPAAGDAAAQALVHGPDHGLEHGLDHAISTTRSGIGIDTRSSGAPASAASGGGNPFTALDAGSGPGSPTTWIHAGAQRAEAGFNDPQLGWVGVRADLTGGSVHAAVLSGSAEATQALGGHLAGLSAHLAEHHIPVDSVSIARQDAGTGGGGFQQGSAQQQGQGTGGGSGGQSTAGEPGAPRGAPLSAALASSYAGSSPAPVYPSGYTAAGRHISVMA
jgi:hypothetical protein